jgi:hypothetical protein
MSDSIEAIIATFPETFGLKAFPGKVFRISASMEQGGKSYASPHNGPQLVTQVNATLFMPARWLDFSRDTPSELRTEVVGGYKGYRDRAAYESETRCATCGVADLLPGETVCYFCEEDRERDQIHRLGPPAGQFY